VEGRKFVIGLTNWQSLCYLSSIYWNPKDNWDVRTISETESCGSSSGIGRQSALQYPSLLIKKNPLLKDYYSMKCWYSVRKSWSLGVLLGKSMWELFTSKPWYTTGRSMPVQCVERESYFDVCNDWDRFRRFVAFGTRELCGCVKLSLSSTN
jgi:hypothetical protein